MHKCLLHFWQKLDDSPLKILLETKSQTGEPNFIFFPTPIFEGIGLIWWSADGAVLQYFQGFGN